MEHGWIENDLMGESVNATLTAIPWRAGNAGPLCPELSYPRLELMAASKKFLLAG